MTTTQEDRIIEKISQEVKKEIVKKYGSLQDTCSEAALAMKKLLDDEEFCVKIGLSGALRVERIRATYEWDENEYEHEYVRIGGIDYDPTQEQFSGFEINMEVIEENADFPPENFIDSVDDILESVKKSFEGGMEDSEVSHEEEKPYRGYVKIGELYFLQIPTNDGFEIASDDQTWTNGFGIANGKEIEPVDESEVPEEDRYRLGWILEQESE